MSWLPADARFLLQRMSGLAHRGLASLHTRGWRATWARVQAVLRRRRTPPGLLSYAPADDAPPHAVPASAAPVASIVIPVFNQVAHTLRCLRSLADHPPRVACEVIVVDDGSSDATAQRVPAIAGVRYVRRARNGGFIAACNDGAAQARGAYLVFLNNDTVPQPGWLDALLETFDEVPEAGLAGAQLRDPDGRLQEAGGVVFADGSGWNYGRGESPDDPRFSYLRDADYASGAAIALPRALFESLGGFDAHYAPAYYEDTDLAFKVRAAGHRVVYQPASVVVHAEGATSGTDVRTGVKAYQVRNRERFHARHADALARQPAPGTLPSPAVLHRAHAQVLVIDALTPAPDHDSGSLRLVNLMRLLREEGAHVVFLPADLAHAGEDTRRLQRLGVEAWHAPFAGGAPAWMRAHGARFDAVMMSRHYVAAEFLPLVRRHAPRARAIFDSVDLHYLREQRGAELAGDDALRRAAARTRARELAVVAQSDTTLVVSPVERELLARDAPDARVEVVSNLHRLPDPGPPFERRDGLVFVGGFRHPPNVDAVAWFVREVFPRVRARMPEVRFHCIGGHVTAEIAALAGVPGVVVHGHVPDIAPWMDGCRVAVAPLRYGAGVKGKVNLSMAHGQPVVATPAAVEGMHLVEGRDVLVAADADAFAAEVVRLHSDAVLWEQLARNGRDNVQRHFSLDAARGVVRRVFLEGAPLR